MRRLDLVSGKCSGEFIGSVDLGDITTNKEVFKNVEKLATHVLVLITHSLSFASFATTDISSQTKPAFFGKPFV